MHGLPDLRPRRAAPPPPTLALPRQRRRPWGGVVVSLLVHGGLVAALWWPAKSLLDDGGGGGGIGPRGGGGGGGRSISSVIALEAYAAPVEAEPQPEPETPVPTIALEDIPAPDLMPLDALARIEVPRGAAGAGAGSGAGPGSGTGTGGGRGSGTGSGVGTGEGPGSGGDGSYILRAQPRGIILPPQCVSRGSRFLVRFWVGADGRVTDVDIDPPPREASCRRDFEVRMRGYRFEPAKTREGLAVASIFPITIER